MKILDGIVITGRINMVARVSKWVCGVIDGMELIDGSKCGFAVRRVALEEELKSNEVLLEEVDVVEHWTIFQGMSSFAACSA